LASTNSLQSLLTFLLLLLFIVIMDITSDFLPFFCFVHILLLCEKFPKVFCSSVRPKRQEHSVQLRVMTLNSKVGVDSEVILHFNIVTVHEVKHLICHFVFFPHVAATVLKTGFVLSQLLQ
jgi:hypothetical protein